MQISEPIILVLISVIVTAIIGPVVLFFLSRIFGRNKDGADLAQSALTIANQAVDDLAQAKEEIRVLKRDMIQLRKEKTAPIRVQVDIIRDPELIIGTATVTVLEEREAR